jgi:exopolysaccharide biosynthesis operon protein EpsL
MEILVSRYAALLATAAALLAVPAHAKEGDTFRPFVSYARYYDDNLFRLAKDEQTFVVQDGVPVVIDHDSASDQYGVLSAGLNVDWKPGRQHITASATRNWVRFSRYTTLDYDGSDYQGRWNWRLGDRFSGLLGATESVTQSNFTDMTLHGLEAVNNKITRDHRFANAEWQFHPRWHVGAGASKIESSNTRLTVRDHDADIVSATLGYTTLKRSKLRAEFRQADGAFPNRSPLDNRGRAYTQTEYNLLGDWITSGKLVARGQVGYVQRENETHSDRDFSGAAGRVSADYSLSAKTMLTGAVYREIRNAETEDANYALTTGAMLGAAWMPTAKLTLRINTSFENRKLEGDVDPLLHLPQRKDDTASGMVSLSYAPVPMASIDLGLQAGRRDSNKDVYDYTFRSVFLSVRGDF